MKTYIFVVFLASSFLLSKLENVPIEERSANSGGIQAKEGEFPFFVLVRSELMLCGGVLIGHKWIITVGTCVDRLENITVEFGSAAIDFMPKMVEVEAYMSCPDVYIMLVRLKCPIEYTSTVQPIALPSANDRVGGGVSLITVGFQGRMTNPLGFSILHHASVTTISNTECIEVFGKTVVSPSKLCTKGGPQNNNCWSSVGGPLIQYDGKGVATVVALFYFASITGCDGGNPIGYLRTSAARNWIREKTGI